MDATAWTIVGASHEPPVERPARQPAPRRVHGLEERRLRLPEPGRLDVGVEGLRRPVVSRHVVPLPALLVEPQPAPAPLSEVVLPPHPQDRAHPREAVERPRPPRPARWAAALAELRSGMKAGRRWQGRDYGVWPSPGTEPRTRTAICVVGRRLVERRPPAAIWTLRQSAFSFVRPLTLRSTPALRPRDPRNSPSLRPGRGKGCRQRPTRTRLPPETRPLPHRPKTLNYRPTAVSHRSGVGAVCSRGRGASDKDDIMQTIWNTLIMAVVVTATAQGATQGPSEYAENSCDGQPSGAECWRELANHPACYFWTTGFVPGLPVAWTGTCRGSLAEGEGELLAPPVYRPPATGGLGPALTQRGSFENGKKHGKWHESNFGGMDGSVSEGTYVHGVQHGHWVIDGGPFVLEGSFSNGKRHGHWVEREIGRYVREGPYVEDQRHGHWVERSGDGDVEEGPYVDGKRHGHWVKRRSDGTVETASYVAGDQTTDWTTLQKRP